MQQFKRSSDDTIDFSSSSNWRLTKIFLSIIGAWPLQSLANRCVLTSVTSILLASMFIPEVLKLITIRKNMNEVLICMPYISMHISAIIGIVNLSFHSRKMKILLLRVQKDWRNTLIRIERDIILNEQYDHAKILKFYIVYVCSLTSIYLIAPLLPIIFDQIKPLNESRPRIHVYHTEFFLDKEKYDVPLLIHAFIFTPLPTTAIVAFDSMFATNIQHACSIFKIVGKRLQFAINNVECQRPEQDFLMVQTKILRALVESVRMHTDILQFIDHLQAAFSTNLLIMNFMSMMNLSMTAYQAMNDSNNSAEMVGLGFYAIGQLIRLYFRCWHGQILINSSESVFDSVYQNNWYDLPVRLRRFIILILTRGKKQTRITAAKIFDMSMENFTFVSKDRPQPLPEGI